MGTNALKSDSVFIKQLSSITILFPQHTEKDVLRSDVFVRSGVGFFRRIEQNALAFIADREVNGRRDLLA
jgi:hypothetical protein